MSQAKDFPSCSLYLSDLDDILSIMAYSPSVNSIFDRAFEYANLEELKSKQGLTPKELFIENTPSGLALRIGNGKTQLTSVGNPSAIASFAQVQEILNAKRRKILYLLL